MFVRNHVNPQNHEILSSIAPLQRRFYYPSSMSTSNTYDEFLKDFRDTVLSATSQLRDIPEAAVRQRSSPDDWSPIEVLGHLIDSAANNHQRFVRAQFTEDLVFPGYEQNQWVTAQRYREESWQDVIQLWSAYNLHLVHVASGISKDELTRPRVNHNQDVIAFKLVDKNEPATLEYLIRDYVVHLRHHLNEIFQAVK